LLGLEPTNEIPHGSADSVGARSGIQRNQMETSNAGLSRLGLRLYLNQLVVTGQAKGAGRDGVLGRWGNGGCAPLGGRSGSSGRVTAQEAATQRNQL
jgi:hypothetical protein